MFIQEGPIFNYMRKETIDIDRHRNLRIVTKNLPTYWDNECICHENEEAEPVQSVQMSMAKDQQSHIFIFSLSNIFKKQLGAPT